MARSIKFSAVDTDINQMTMRIIQRAFKYGIEDDLIFGNMLEGAKEQVVTELSDTQNYDWGTVRWSPKSGKWYRYSRSSGMCWTGRGNKFQVTKADGIDFALLGASQNIGDKQIIFAVATHPAFAKDELKGGLVLISDEDITTEEVDRDSQVMQRVCTGNDVSEEDTVCIIYLDEPLTRIVTTNTKAFVIPNPYSKIAYDDSVWTSVAGIPGVYISEPGKCFWLQDGGPCWLSHQPTEPGTGPGITPYAREVVFHNDGTLGIHTPDLEIQKYAQHAGYIMDNNVTEDGCRLFQLQIGP